MKLNINTHAAVVFTNKLEKLHRSALPNAIRNTLNKAAFDVKQNTMPASAGKTFKNRSPNFFKANSRVEMAKGFDIGSMKATIGFTSQNLKGGNNYAVKELEEQEEGGAINKRSFIPMDVARAGGNNAQPVRPSNRLSSIKKIVNPLNSKGKNSHQAFIKAAIYAGKGGFVLGNNSRKTLFRIVSIRKQKVRVFGRSSRTIVKTQPLYSFEENRKVLVSATHFMRKASLRTSERIDKYYIEEANKQIQKLK
jgi:hypothetical protein